MTARILPITRPQERLITVPEVAERLEVSYETAATIVKRYGICPSGRKGGRWYITEAALHRALMGTARQ